jgi:hypothetical protein
LKLNKEMNNRPRGDADSNFFHYFTYILPELWMGDKYGINKISLFFCRAQANRRQAGPRELL